MLLHLHHIAILVRSLEIVEKSLPGDLERLKVESFPAEGTKEQYIDLDPSGRPCLLLIEAIGEGPYRRALSKRGPGIHHLGLVTDNLDAAVGHFSGERLLIHPFSMKSITQRVIWMCRPGVPFLVEIIEKQELDHDPPPAVHLEFPVATDAIFPRIPGVTMRWTENPWMTVSSNTSSFNIDT